MTKQTASKVPDIRFNGFVDEWKELPVGQVIRDHVERTVVHNQYPVLTSSQQHGIVMQKDYFANRQVTTDKNIGYLVLPRGYFSYRSRSDNDSFVFNRNDVLDKGIISYYYPVFEVKDCDSDFFLRRINFGLQRQLSIAAEGTGQRVLAHSQFKKLTANYPGLTEQIKIGEYFRELDSLIGLHQSKHDKLVTLKKAMLQKMLPQPGATTPEIRFKGFSGEWMEKEFNLIASRSSQSCSENNLPRIEYEDIVSGAGRLNKNLFKKVSQKAGVKFAKGDVLFGKLRPYLRNWWLAEFEGIAVGDFWVLTSATAMHSFLYCLIQTEAFERIANQSAGSKMPRSDWKLVSNSLFRTPSDPVEQQKIGTYFRTLDELISQHATQLKKLQQLKSACLEKMFV